MEHNSKIIDWMQKHNVICRWNNSILPLPPFHWRLLTLPTVIFLNTPLLPGTELGGKEGRAQSLFL